MRHVFCKKIGKTTCQTPTSHPPTIRTPPPHCTPKWTNPIACQSFLGPVFTWRIDETWRPNQVSCTVFNLRFATWCHDVSNLPMNSSAFTHKTIIIHSSFIFFNFLDIPYVNGVKERKRRSWPTYSVDMRLWIAQRHRGVVSPHVSTALLLPSSPGREAPAVILSLSSPRLFWWFLCGLCTWSMA
jgi:hypothetical protein